MGEENTLRYLRFSPKGDSPAPPKWQSDGKWFSDVPIVFSRKRSRAEILAPTPYGRVLYQEVQAGVLIPQHWESIGKAISGPLCGVSKVSNQIDVFSHSNGRVLHKALVMNSWAPKDDWQDLGTFKGGISLPPAVVSIAPGRLDIVGIVGYGRDLVHKHWHDGRWWPSETEWDSIGGYWYSAPAAVTTAPNRFDVFTLGPERQLIQYTWNRWWSGSTSQLGNFLSRPCAVSPRAGYAHVFCIGVDHQMYHRIMNIYDKPMWFPNNSWHSLGGDFDSVPTAISGGGGKVYVFCKGTDEEIYFQETDYKTLGTDKWVSLGMAG
jgi:hypothetical protein